MLILLAVFLVLGLLFFGAATFIPRTMEQHRRRIEATPELPSKILGISIASSENDAIDVCSQIGGKMLPASATNGVKRAFCHSSARDVTFLYRAERTYGRVQVCEKGTPIRETLAALSLIAGRPNTTGAAQHDASWLRDLRLGSDPKQCEFCASGDSDASAHCWEWGNDSQYLRLKYFGKLR